MMIVDDNEKVFTYLQGVNLVNIAFGDYSDGISGKWCPRQDDNNQCFIS